MVQKLDLDEREHALCILQRLDQMKRDQQHCDFIVSVEGNEFHAHRNILSAGSDYFNAMLTHDTKESQLGRVEMMDVNSECVEICLNYIYTGKAEIPEDKTEQLIGIASLMQLAKLTNAASELLKRSLNTNTFYSVRRIAEMYDLQDLLATCRTFEQENILSLSSQDDFQNEHEAHVIKILTTVGLAEQEKVTLSLRWAGGLAKRKNSLLDFLKCINLEQVLEDYLHHILENNPLIKNDLQLYKIFSIALIRGLKVAKKCKYDSLVLFDNSSDSLRHLNPRTNNIDAFHEGKFAEFKKFSAIAQHSYIYVLSQNKSVHRLRFEDKKAKWEKMQDMIEHHGKFPPSLSLDGFLYIVGGSHEQCTNISEKFFPDENQWIRLKDMPVFVKKASLVSEGEFIYSVGGETEQGLSNALYKFNSQSSEWTELEPMRQAKHSCGAVAVNWKIYIFGGDVGEDTGLSDMDCYDVASKQWTRLSPMIGSHYLINAHHMSGWIFAVERLAESDTIEKYDIEKNEWQMVKLTGTDEFLIYDSVMI